LKSRRQRLFRWIRARFYLQICRAATALSCVWLPASSSASPTAAPLADVASDVAAGEPLKELVGHHVVAAGVSPPTRCATHPRLMCADVWRLALAGFFVNPVFGSCLLGSCAGTRRSKIPDERRIATIDRANTIDACLRL
jgi:hypothetical protein